MSPTVFREGEYRFFFFSREEPRMHVHVICGDGETKYWLQPNVELARNQGLSNKQLKDIERIIKERYREIASAWHTHFGG